MSMTRRVNMLELRVLFISIMNQLIYSVCWLRNDDECRHLARSKPDRKLLTLHIFCSQTICSLVVMITKDRKYSSEKIKYCLRRHIYI